MTLPAIILDRVSASYGRTHALAPLSATIATGSLTALTGPNGSGKSTLLKLIAGILKPRSGSITVNLPLAYLPQQSVLQRDFPMNALEAAATGLWPSLGERGGIDAAALQRVRGAMHEVGLLGCENRPLHALSGGQFQRLLFARVIVQDAPLILLDEPFTGIDEETIAILISLIRDWNREGRTVLCVLHDRALVEKYFPNRLELKESTHVSA